MCAFFVSRSRSHSLSVSPNEYLRIHISIIYFQFEMKLRQHVVIIYTKTHILSHSRGRMLCINTYDSYGLWLNRKNTTKTAATATTTHISNQSLVVKQSVGVFTMFFFIRFLSLCAIFVGFYSFSIRNNIHQKSSPNDNDFITYPDCFAITLSKCKISLAKIPSQKLGQINYYMWTSQIEKDVNFKNLSINCFL